MIVTLGLCAGAASAKGTKGAKGAGKHAVEHNSKLDTNGDGLISLDEFTAKARAKFEKADTNHDGQLSKSEQAMMEKQSDKKQSDKKQSVKKHSVKK